jgi:Cu-processing system permease protein
MNAGSTLPSASLTPPSAPLSPRPVAPLESMPVPTSWRIMQLVLLFIIGAGAIFYHSMWKMFPPVEKKVTDFLGFMILGGLVALTTPTVGTIAKSAFFEALRRRWVIGFVAFSMLIIAFSGSLTFVQLGEEQRFLQDFGTGFIIAMTILITIFLGVTLIPPDIERRTIFTVLSKPVNRLEYILGKYLGLCLTLFFCLAILGGFFLLVYMIFSLRQNPAAWTTGTASEAQATLGFQLTNLAKALILHYGQLVVLASLSLLLSLIVSPITAITFCFLAYFGGQMSSYWGHLGGDAHAGEETRGLSGPMQAIVKGIYYALPRMDHFDVRQQLVTDSMVMIPVMWKAWSSGLLYVGVLLTISYLVFSDREF